MTKWYEQPQVDESVIMTSRVRLARNLSGYSFPTKLTSAGAAAVMDEIKAAITNENLTFTSLAGMTTGQLSELSERHVISPAMAMLNNTSMRGLIYNIEENISIMLNEEDHLRIQAIFAQQDLDKAYQTAAELDNTMSQHLEYAFDAEFGFLTSCPTNTGTGLRASYMLHVPLLESTGNLKVYADIITKAGFAIRGGHGEGSESMGGIYQISNQTTLGKTEAETISSLKHLTNQVVDREHTMREHVLKEYRAETEDAVFRAYGILTNCRKISLTEAMKLLSEIRLGNILGLLNTQVHSGSIYNLMTHALPHNLQKLMGPAKDARQLDILRAEYLRNAIS